MSMELSMTAAAILQSARTLPPPPGHGRAEARRDRGWPQLAAGAATVQLLRKAERRQHRTDERLDADPAQSPDRGPPPSREWAPTVNYLTNLARLPLPPPSWWKTHAQFRASIETWTAPRRYCLGDNSSQESSDTPAISLRLTLAGWGHFRLQGEEPHRITPGQGFFATASSEARHYLPEGSPGWTFARIEIYHPYLKSRLSEQVNATGPLVDLAPDEALTASVVRLVRGAIAKDFRDHFDAEMALFDFVLTFERWARQTANEDREAQRLVDDVRLHVLAGLPKAIDLCSLAAHFGMSRSHFSHLFRKQTGITPAHFATEVRIQRVEKLLLDTHAPLKTIADNCGFANANHLCKVFRRLRHYTPNAFRQAIRSSTSGYGVERPENPASARQ